MITLVSPDEKRLYTRLSKRIPVSIHYNGHCVSRCSTNNISIGGALLDDQDLGLTENALIEIIFGVNQWHALYEIKLPAIVVWRNETQIAVSFELLRKDTEELLVDHDVVKSDFDESQSLSY
ncbi:MAG: PilZ domain-containing protein [Gammaproteobacteria bacterium]